MTCGSYLADQLHQRGFRMTPQRMAILHVLKHAGRHLSPVEVLKRSRRSQPGLRETTVYRTLDFLANNGFAQVAHVGGGRLVYEMTGHNHHHLICRSCGLEVVMEHEALIPLFQRLNSFTGYKLDSSHITLFGLCPDCQPASP